jgi:predicted ATP-dependent endonuclease of OLD family
MRIKNLRIESFGKLESVSIGLDEKITVIHGKNEAGKSSIASFIKYMLYGFDSTKKADVSENMKKKYMPWDSNECSGGMTFVSSDGKMYTAALWRGQRALSPRSRKYRAALPEIQRKKRWPLMPGSWKSGRAFLWEIVSYG